MKLTDIDQTIDDETDGLDQPKAIPAESGQGANARKGSKRSHEGVVKAPAIRPAEGVRPGTKQAKLIGLLSRGAGATIEQLAKALDWQKHTVRGAISGALKKKLGLKVVTQKNAAEVLVYRIR